MTLFLFLGDIVYYLVVIESLLVDIEIQGGLYRLDCGQLLNLWHHRVVLIMLLQRHTVS